MNDYSAGNDQIIAKSDISSISDLKGKSIGVEKGLVDHLLLNSALTENGLTEEDVTLVNATTNELPQVFTNETIDAVAIWQPNANQALQNVPSAKALYTSADKPGLIYDTLAVSPASLSVSIKKTTQRLFKYGVRSSTISMTLILEKMLSALCLTR